MLKKILNPKEVLDVFHWNKEKLNVNLTELKEKLRSRFFVSDSSRKEFYIVLMSSIAGFDAIMDDADLVHENKIYTIPNFSSFDESRMHHLIWLGKAYWVSSSEQHTERLKLEIGNFLTLQRNKDWFDSIDSKIAIINVITSLLYFLKSTHVDDKFLIDFLSFIFRHGYKLKKSLGNISDSINYCAGLTALLFIGVVFLDTREGKKWVKESFDGLQKYILDDVMKDGTHSSRDLNCHLLCTEILTTAYVLLRLNGYRVTDPYIARLELMYDFLDSALDKSGRCHLASSKCSGRLFRTSSRTERYDLRDLMAVGAAIFKREDFRTTAERYSDLALMLLGGEGYEKFSTLSPTEILRSKIFKDGHFAFFKSEQNWGCFDFGFSDEGTKRPGEGFMSFAISGVNDFVLHRTRGKDILPGPVYSGALVLKYNENELMKYTVENTSIISTMFGSKEDIIEVEKDLRTKKQRFSHWRRLSFNKVKRSFLIEDRLSGSGKFNINIPLYFNHGLKVTRIGRNTLTLEGEEFAFLKIDNEFELVSVDDTWPESLIIKWSGNLPFTNAIFIFITASLDDLNHIINTSR